METALYSITALPFRIVDCIWKDMVDPEVPLIPRVGIFLLLSIFQFSLTLQSEEPCDSWAEEYIFGNHTF